MKHTYRAGIINGTNIWRHIISYMVMRVQFISRFTEVKTRICCDVFLKYTLITRFLGSTWGPAGAERTQLDPMLTPWTLLSGYVYTNQWGLSASSHFYQTGSGCSRGEGSTTISSAVYNFANMAVIPLIPWFMDHTDLVDNSGIKWPYGDYYNGTLLSMTVFESFHRIYSMTWRLPH